MRITKEPEVRKSEILAAAKTLFDALGVEKTSMDQIARQAQVTKGLVYYYFDSKDSLVSAVVESLVEETEEQLHEILGDGNLDFMGKLSRILGFYFVVIRQNATLMSLSNTNPGVFELVKNRLVESAIQLTAGWFHQGVEEGVLHIDYPEYVLKILISGIADLYQEGVEDPRIIATIIEQTLSIPRGSLEIR